MKAIGAAWNVRLDRDEAWAPEIRLWSTTSTT
jgi:hypothetical protein